MKVSEFAPELASIAKAQGITLKFFKIEYQYHNNSIIYCVYFEVDREGSGGWKSLDAKSLEELVFKIENLDKPKFELKV